MDYGPTNLADRIAVSLTRLVSSEIGGSAVGWDWKAGAKQPPQAVRQSQSQQDQEFEKRQRIAERLVRDLREAGYSCDLGDSGGVLRDN